MSESVRIHSAAHLLKGALQKVLGVLTTYSMGAGGQGSITVLFDREVNRDEIEAIQSEANRKVEENVEFLQFEMDRTEAEMHFGSGIYEAAPPPPDVALLRLIRIPEWEISRCDEPHVETASEIGRITVDGATLDGTLLEVRFHVA